MKMILTAVFLLALSGAAFAGGDCGRLNELKREWVALEEKTSGGLFFSGPSEANRLHTLRRIMEQPGAITVDCRRKRRNADVDIRYEPLRPVR